MLRRLNRRHSALLRRKSLVIPPMRELAELLSSPRSVLGGGGSILIPKESQLPGSGVVAPIWRSWRNWIVIHSFSILGIDLPLAGEWDWFDTRWEKKTLLLRRREREREMTRRVESARLGLSVLLKGVSSYPLPPPTWFGATWSKNKMGPAYVLIHNTLIVLGNLDNVNVLSQI